MSRSPLVPQLPLAEMVTICAAAGADQHDQCNDEGGKRSAKGGTATAKG